MNYLVVMIPLVRTYEVNINASKGTKNYVRTRANIMVVLELT